MTYLSPSAHPHTPADLGADADAAHPAAPSPIARHDGWTPERRARFLDKLASVGNVRVACGAAGLSREAAYRLRRRDAVFARAWAAALVLAREHSTDVLGERAIDGLEEEVWYKGEVVGTRRRFDTRLLLAHLARLDTLTQDYPAAEDATRFDELVARAAGVPLPEDLVSEDAVLPLPREDCVDAAGADAVRELIWQEADEEGEGPETDGDENEDDAPDANEDAAPGANGEDAADDLLDPEIAAYRAATAGVAARWDQWLAHACTAVDRLLDDPPEPGAPAAPVALRTACTMSTWPHVGHAPDAARYGVQP